MDQRAKRLTNNLLRLQNQVVELDRDFLKLKYHTVMFGNEVSNAIEVMSTRIDELEALLHKERERELRRPLRMPRVSRTFRPVRRKK